MLFLLVFRVSCSYACLSARARCHTPFVGLTCCCVLRRLAHRGWSRTQTQSAQDRIGLAGEESGHHQTWQTTSGDAKRGRGLAGCDAEVVQMEAKED